MAHNHRGGVQVPLPQQRIGNLHNGSASEFGSESVGSTPSFPTT